MRKPARKLLRSIARLRSTLRACRNRLGHQLAERGAERDAARRSAAQPDAADPTVTYGPIFDHLDAELEAIASELADAENAYAVAQYSADQLRKRRKEAALELGGRHRLIERFCRSQPNLKSAGIVDSTPDCPYALVQQVSWTVEFLRDLEADAAAERKPPALTAGVKIDAGSLADELEAGLPGLKAVITEMGTAESDVVFTRERANVGFAEADEVLSWVARTLDGLSGLAGEEKLAGRIRRCCG